MSLIANCAGCAGVLDGSSDRFWQTVCDWGSRAQDPTTRNYTVREVLIEGGAGDVKLAGELTMPYGPGPFPAVILISGSGRFDRNETVLGHRPFLVLSDHLTRNGYAVFRYDDRGVGESTGDFYAATDDDFARDVVAALRWLRHVEGVDADKLGFVGHSQGGFVGPIAAAIDEPDFMVLLASGVQSNGDLYLSQNLARAKAMNFTEDQLHTVEDKIRQINKMIGTSTTVEELRARIIAFVREKGGNQRRAIQTADIYATPWSLAEFDRDIKPYLRRFGGPVLALFGGKDILVSAAVNSPAIKPLLAHPDSVVLTVPGVNHFFQKANRGGIEEVCDIDTTIEPAVLDTITNWLDVAVSQIPG